MSEAQWFFSLGVIASSVFHFVLWLMARRIDQKHRCEMADLDVKLHAELARARVLHDEFWRLREMDVFCLECDAKDRISRKPQKAPRPLIITVDSTGQKCRPIVCKPLQEAS